MNPILKNPMELAANSRTFFREVVLEARKVSWPAQKETLGGTIGVLALVAIATVVLFLVDGVLSWTMGIIWP